MRTRSAAAFLIALVPIAVFLPVLSGNFVNWDDDAILLHNPWILSLGWRSLKWMFTSLYMTTYQPLGWLAYALLQRCRGLDALFFHRANLLAHAFNTAALFLVLLGLLPKEKAEASSPLLGAAFAALAWSLHPLQVESVQWATELPDLLAASFFFLSILAYQRRERSRAWLWASSAAFLASGLFRWKGVSLPLLLIMMDLFTSGKVRWRDKVPFFVIGAGLVAVNALAKAQIQGIRLSGALRHPVGAAYACYFYLQKTLLPLELMPLYRLKDPMLPGALAAAAITLLAFRFRKTWPAALLGWLWYIAAILPTTATSKEGVMFGQDHYAYLPLAGLAFSLAWALRARKAPLVRGLFLLLLPLAVLSRRQAVIWRDSVLLWTQAAAIDQDSCVALGNLRSALIQEKRFDEAYLIQREERLRCSGASAPLIPEPSSKTALAKAYSNMGVDRFDLGRTKEAVGYFERALRLDPDIPEIRRNLAIAVASLRR